MKYLFILFFTLFLSCEQKIENDSAQTQIVEKAKPAVDSSTSEFDESQPWFAYYQKENSNFKAKSFQLKDSSAITYQESSIAILNQKGFNEIYKPFLVFNKSKDKYIDFYSYQWFLEPNGTAGFEADQQIVLVDYKNKSAKQIGFFGPSYWIEDAYWKGDSAVVLLGNTYEKVPFILKYNFEKNKVQNFQYPDTLKITVPYSKLRLRNHGIKVE